MIDGIRDCSFKAMLLLRFPVTVVIERVPLTNRWVSEQWRVAAVEPLPDDNVSHATERLPDQGDVVRWRCSGFAVELTRSESEGYYLNISSPERMCSSRGAQPSPSMAAPRRSSSPRSRRNSLPIR